MKCLKIILSILFITSTSLWAAEVPVEVVGSGVVRIATGEWPPYISKKLKHYGVVSHVIKEAFAEENIKVVYTFFPWKRALKQVMNGNWDASPSWVPTPERLHDFHFSDVVHTSSKVFFYLKDKPFEWRSINDLQNYTIGATLGYTYGETFDKSAENGQIIVVPLRSDLLNFKMLLKGRIELFPVEKEVGFSILGEYFSVEDRKRFTFHPKPVLETSHHLIFTKHAKKSLFLLDKFNQGLAKLKASGEFKRMFEASLRGEYKAE
ncbi:substrate-binding periplasmic protein [Zooshikella ganghwensis]|uniref:Solute-binding protein family 3/N-terminal domain-containing protein n=1 Tax=Zooshikella ganghwensis TaxID=202772 RepID=A0A4P9VKH6_9GAMM|nr:transporter substrate-binding domain-containing protein [Zooshikella ganghwensis]RDH43753.1 hypothetical protein B9G39_10025 [Zooshikella ganghwensis]